jgi:hypothetical protein
MIRIQLPPDNAEENAGASSIVNASLLQPFLSVLHEIYYCS